MEQFPNAEPLVEFSVEPDQLSAGSHHHHYPDITPDITARLLRLSEQSHTPEARAAFRNIPATDPGSAEPILQ